MDYIIEILGPLLQGTAVTLQVFLLTLLLSVPLGLGLALVRAIAARHGAKLEMPAAEKGFVLDIGWPKLAP